MFKDQSLPEIPDKYKCCLSLQIMLDPVMAADGHTYEREEIERHLKNSDKSPKTNLVLEDKRLIPNHDKRSDIIEFLEKYPGFYSTDEVYLSETLKKELADAIKQDNIDTIKALLKKHKSLLLAELEHKYTAFHMAAQFGSVKGTNHIFEVLTASNLINKVMDAPAGFQPVHLNSLLEQELEKDIDIKQCAEEDLLLKLGAGLEQVTSSQNTLLHRMVLKGKRGSVEWLLNNGAKLESVNAQGNTPLLLAVLANNLSLTKFLLGEGANRNVKNNEQRTPLFIALAVHQNKSLLSLFVSSNQASLLPLHLAIALSDDALMNELLEQKVIEIDVNAKDVQGKTCLQIAFEKNDSNLVNLLLKKGADPKVLVGAQGGTLAHAAAAQGRAAVLKRLVEAKVSVDVTDDTGDTPLHVAASNQQNQQEEVIAYLLEKGVIPVR